MLLPRIPKRKVTYASKIKYFDKVKPKQLRAKIKLIVV